MTPESDREIIGVVNYKEDDWVGLMLEPNSDEPWYAEIYEDEFNIAFIEFIV